MVHDDGLKGPSNEGSPGSDGVWGRTLEGPGRNPQGLGIFGHCSEWLPRRIAVVCKAVIIGSFATSNCGSTIVPTG